MQRTLNKLIDSATMSSINRLFPNLNLFLYDQVIPVGHEPINLRLDEVEAQQANGSVLKFKTVTILPEDNFYHRTIDKVPKDCISLLEALYNQILELVSQQRHELHALFVDTERPGDFVREFTRFAPNLVEHVYSSFQFYVVRKYENTFANARSKTPNNILENVVKISLASYTTSVLPGKDLSDLIVASSLQASNEKKAINLNQVQQLSLFRLIWAVEAVNKIKYALIHREKTVVFLDNAEFQIRQLYVPLYATRFNLDTLSIFDQSPELQLRLQQYPLTIMHMYWNEFDLRSEYFSAYMLGTKSLIASKIVLSKIRYTFYEQYRLYKFAFLPLASDGDEHNAMNVE